MTDLSTPLMTRFEFDRMKALEASGMSHEAAKTQVYGERGPGGAPVTGDEGSVSANSAAIAPDTATSAVVTDPVTSKLGWLLVAGAVAAGVYFYIKHPKASLVGSVVGDSAATESALLTGVMGAPKRKRRKKK